MDTREQTEVLVFGTMGNIGQEVAKSLASEGVASAIVPFPQNVFNDEPGYRRALVHAIEEFKPEIVFPVGNPLAMARFKDLLEKGVPLRTILNRRETDSRTEEAVRNTKFAVETEKTVRLLDSKVQSYAMAKMLGVLQPPLFVSPKNIPDETKVIFKRDVSFGGHGVHQPKGTEALEKLIAHQSPGEPFLIEEFIEGQDYSLDAVRCCDGIIVSGGYSCIPARKYGSRLPAVLGPAVVRTVLCEGDCILEKMRICAAAILGHLDYHGVCGFDFRTDASGNVWFLECNPRFTGGIAAQTSAGFNIPIILYRSVQSPDFLSSHHGHFYK